MQPRRKNALTLLTTILYILALSTIGFILVSIGGMILHSIFSIETSKIIFLVYGSLLLILSFHGYKIYRIIKIAKPSKKKIAHEIILRVMFVFFIVLFIYLLLASQYHRKVLDRHYECENTKKEFQGKIFDIQICEAYIYEHEQSRAVRFSVFDQQGRLRALRNFAFRHKGTSIEYKKNGLTYFNSDDENQYFNMPPTALDWLRARVPFSDIGQFDQLWYM